MKQLLRIAAAAPLLAAGAAFAQPAPSPTLTPEQKMAQPAEKTFKNIQVLKGMPTNQLAGTMSFVATSLGVRCGFCHDPADYSSDAKAEKKTARKMMAMQMGINKESFDGRSEVSCWTCHRGTTDPRSVPSLDLADYKPKETGWQRAEAGKEEPQPEVLLARFVEASGGRAALTKHTTRLTTGTETDEEGRTEKLEVLRKAPLSYIATATGEEKGKPTTTVQAYDGKTYWIRHGDRKPNSIWTPQTAVIRREAEFATPLALLELKSTKLRGKEKNGAKTAWVVDGEAADGRRERLWLNAETGLLERRVVTIATYLGRLQYAVDYADYRDVDGAKVPFTCTWSAAGEGWTEKVAEVKNDVDAPDARFAMPAAP